MDTYAISTPVVSLLAAVVDPVDGIPVLFGAELGALVAVVLGAMWLFHLLRRLGVNRRV